MKKMFDYGNTLGNALILQTHYHKLREEMRKQFDSFSPGKSSVLARFRLSDSSADKNPIAAWTAFKDCNCFICQNIEDTFKRYMETFFWLYRQDNEFKNKILRSKGFCLHHFGILCNGADKYLNDKEKALELLGRHLGMFKDKLEVTGLEAEQTKLDDLIRQMRGGG